MSADYSKSIAAIIRRDLRALARELERYPSDAAVWACPPGVRNSAGTLVLHVIGNLEHFIGGSLGKTSYVRDRDSEFARRDVPRAELVAQLERTGEMVERTLAETEDTLDVDFPVPVAGFAVNTADFLVHLAVHLSYHLGQVDYHRRMVAADSAGVSPVAIGELRSARRASGG